MMKHTTTNKLLDSTSDEETQAALVAIYALAEDAGYRITRETAKLAEFVGPNGHILYIEKVRVSLNQIRCCVHPEHGRESLLRMDGVEAVSDAHRFHSNMIRFPKRLHGGKTPTAYGWQVKVETLLDLHRFLTAFAEAPACVS